MFNIIYNMAGEGERVVPLYRIVAIVVCVFFLLVAASLAAADSSITPYGDYCSDCSTYGICSDVLPVSEALSALRKYYESKGYRVGAVYHKGRFIEADIYKNNKQVDKVLLDRKTGRLRSIY
jgi:hypothetical protein